MDSPWNSLEVTNVIISALTPIIGGIIAWKLARIGKDIETRQWTDRKIIEKRLEIYEKLVPSLNDLYCFFLYIGNWKELTPLQIIEAKRVLDKNFHIYSHLFERNILHYYDAFIQNCFQTYTGMGKDAKIRSNWENRVKHTTNWKKEWNNLFLPEDATSKDEIRGAYEALLNIFRAELELKA